MIDKYRHSDCTNHDLKEAQGGSCHEIEFEKKPLNVRQLSEIHEWKYQSESNHAKLSMLLKQAKLNINRNPLNRTYEFPKHDPRFIEHQLRNGNMDISEQEVANLVENMPYRRSTMLEILLVLIHLKE